MSRGMTLLQWPSSETRVGHAEFDLHGYILLFLFDMNLNVLRFI